MTTLNMDSMMVNISKRYARLRDRTAVMESLQVRLLDLESVLVSQNFVVIELSSLLDGLPSATMSISIPSFCVGGTSSVFINQILKMHRSRKTVQSIMQIVFGIISNHRVTYWLSRVAKHILICTFPLTELKPNTIANSPAIVRATHP